MIDSNDLDDIDTLAAALIVLEELLVTADSLLGEATDDGGVDVDFDERLTAYHAKRAALSDWRTRDLLAAGALEETK